MRISELSTEKAASILCEITPFIANISSDEELLKELREVVDVKNANNRAELMLVGATKLTRIIPILLKRRKDDVFGILATLSETSADEIAKQNILTTVAQIREIIKDKELLSFFSSSVNVGESE